jgi:prepilin-type N-terminal cleavage/methylation domain-containing protein
MLKSQSGVGLIEIIIAMLIFGIGISAAMRTLPATNLAQEQLEALMGTPLTSADLTAGGHVDSRNPLERHFTRTWTVTDNVPLTGMKRVAVSVVYEGGGEDRTVTLTTYLTPRR